MEKRKEEIHLHETDSFSVSKVVERIKTHRSAQFTVVAKSDMVFKVCKILGIHKICALVQRS